MSPIALQADRDVTGIQRSPMNHTGSSGVASFGVRHEIVQRALPWLLLSGGMILGILDHRATSAWAVAPFLVSLLIFGMPHGAMDWVVNNRLNGLHGITAQLRGFTGYLVWMTVSIAALVLAPFVTIAAFMLLTIVHFGTADMIATGNDRGGRIRRTAFIASRGLLVLGPAFGFHTAEAWYPFGLLVGHPTLGPEALGAVSTVSLVGTVIGLVVAGTLAVLRMRSGDPKRGAFDLIEGLLVFGAVAATSPLFGVGLFFLSTHAYRHSIRLASTEAVGGDGRRHRLVQSLWTMHLRSFPLLVPTFMIILAWTWWQFGDFSAMHVTVVTIGFFIISTLPHHLLGLRLPPPSTRS